MNLLKAIAVFIALLIPSVSLATPGALYSNGCHGAGQSYHCHGEDVGLTFSTGNKYIPTPGKHQSNDIGGGIAIAVILGIVVICALSGGSGTSSGGNRSYGRSSGNSGQIHNKEYTPKPVKVYSSFGPEGQSEVSKAAEPIYQTVSYFKSTTDKVHILGKEDVKEAMEDLNTKQLDFYKLDLEYDVEDLVNEMDLSFDMNELIDGFEL